MDEYRHENSDTYVDTVKSRNRSPIQLVHDIGFNWPSEKSPERSIIVDDSAQVERKFIRIVPRQNERPVESSVRTIPVVIGIPENEVRLQRRHVTVPNKSNFF